MGTFQNIKYFCGNWESDAQGNFFSLKIFLWNHFLDMPLWYRSPEVKYIFNSLTRMPALKRSCFYRSKHRPIKYLLASICVLDSDTLELKLYRTPEPKSI